MKNNEELIQKLRQEIEAHFLDDANNIVIKSAATQINDTAYDNYLDRQRDYDSLDGDVNHIKRIANNLFSLSEEVFLKEKKESENERSEAFTISSNTLDNFIKNSKKPSLKTLHILSLYLKYFGWYDFVYCAQEEEQRKAKEDKWIRELRNGSISYFEQRFSQLTINEILIPKWEKENINTNVRLDGEENTFSLINGVEKLWEGKKRNCLLIGEGGMGKTFSLVQIWKYYLKENKPNSPIPIYISLNRFNDIDEKDRAGFITNYILENYLQKRFYTDEDKKQLWDLFLDRTSSRENGIPRFILLCDGFNEITVSQTSIRKDFDDWWFTKSQGVQIIISSRYDMRLDYRWHDLQKIELQALPKEIIGKYLSNLQIDIPDEEELLDLLSNPMMLTLFASTNEIIDQYGKYPKFSFKLDFTSQGELMWNFFESQLAKYFETIKYDDTLFIYYSFLLKHIIPFIGYEMERGGKYNIHENKLVEIINTACVVFFNEKFENTFPVYRDHISKFDLGEKQFPETGVRFNKIIQVLCGKLQILIEENHTYKFLHQNFRDFSASVHYLNDISIALEQKSVSESLKSRPLPLYVQKFIGEIEGEHKKKVNFDKGSGIIVLSQSKNNLLDRQLDKLRGVFNDGVTGYACRNIVNIKKQLRKELTGCDLSNLNLRGISFNGVRCYQKNSDTILGVSFDKSLVSEENFSNEIKHSGSVYGVAYSPDGMKVVSGSYDRTIKEWLAETGEYLKTYEGFELGIENVVYSNDCKKILCSGGHRIKEIDIETGRTIEYHCDEQATCLAYSPDDKTFVSGGSDGLITEWSRGRRFSIRTMKEKPSSSTSEKIEKEIESIRYSSDGKELITHSKSGIMQKWSVETGKCVETIIKEKATTKLAAYSSDYRKKIVVENGFELNEYNVETDELLISYETKSSINAISYSPDDERIVAGMHGGGIQQWSCLSGQTLSVSNAFSSEIRCLSYSFDNKKIIAYFSDGFAREWLISTKMCINTYFINARHYKNHIAYSPDNSKFVISSDCDILEYSTTTGELLQQLESNPNMNTIRCISYNHDGKKVIAGLGNKTCIWSMESGRCIQTYKKPLSYIIFIIWSPSGDRFATISEHANEIKEWDADTGDFIRTYSGYYNHLEKIKYQRDGKVLISFSKNNKICKWEVASGEMLYPYNKPRYFKSGSAFEKFKDINTYLDISNNGQRGILYYPNGTVIEDCSLDFNGDVSQRITDYSGLLINGCSFLNLHSDSKISDNFKTTMLNHEAVFL